MRNPSRCPSADFALCKNYTGTFGYIENVVCDAPVFGRFVKLWKRTIRDAEDILSFCELEVYGVKTGRMFCINKLHDKFTSEFGG